MSDADNFDLESLLDATLDDLKDLAQFATFPAGAMRCKVSTAIEKSGKGDSLKVEWKATMELLEVMELSNPEDPAPAIGSKASVNVLLNTETGQGFFKMYTSPVAENFGVQSIREINEVMNGCECIVLCGKPRPGNKNSPSYDPDVKYTRVISFNPV